MTDQFDDASSRQRHADVVKRQLADGSEVFPGAAHGQVTGPQAGVPPRDGQPYGGPAYGAPHPGPAYPAAGAGGHYTGSQYAETPYAQPSYPDSRDTGSPYAGSSYPESRDTGGSYFERRDAPHAGPHYPDQREAPYAGSPYPGAQILGPHYDQQGPSAYPAQSYPAPQSQYPGPAPMYPAQQPEVSYQVPPGGQSFAVPPVPLSGNAPQLPSGGAFVPRQAPEQPSGGAFVPRQAAEQPSGGAFVPRQAPEQPSAGAFVPRQAPEPPVSGLPQVSPQTRSAAGRPTVPFRPPPGGITPQQMPASGLPFTPQPQQLPASGVPFTPQPQQLPASGVPFMPQQMAAGGMPVAGQQMPVMGQQMPVAGQQTPMMGQHTPFVSQQMPFPGQLQLPAGPQAAGGAGPLAPEMPIAGAQPGAWPDAPTDQLPLVTTTSQPALPAAAPAPAPAPKRTLLGRRPPPPRVAGRAVLVYEPEVRKPWRLWAFTAVLVSLTVGVVLGQAEAYQPATGRSAAGTQGGAAPASAPPDIVQPAPSNLLTAPLGAVKARELQVAGAATTLRIRTADLGDVLFNIVPLDQTTTPSLTDTDKGTRLELISNNGPAPGASTDPSAAATGGSPPPPAAGGVEIVLNAKVAWTLKLDGNTTDLDLDTRAGGLDSLTTAGTITRAVLQMPKPKATVPVTFGGAVSEMTVRTETGAPVRVRLAKGAELATVGGKSTKPVKAGNTLTEAGWAATKSHYDVKASAAVKTLVVDHQGPID